MRLRVVVIALALVGCRRDPVAVVEETPMPPATRPALVTLDVAPRAPVGERAPVLVLLHGVGSNERDLVSLTRTFDPRLRVISVRAPLVLGPHAYAWFHVTFTAQGPVHDAPEAEAARVQLVSFLEELRRDPHVDPHAIFLLGFSQGAILSLSVALTAPELVTAVVAIAGRTLQEIQAQTKGRTIAHPPHVLLVHGEQDAKLPFSHAQTSDAVLTAAGVPHELRAYAAGHEINAAMHGDIGAWLVSRLPPR